MEKPAKRTGTEKLLPKSLSRCHRDCLGEDGRILLLFRKIAASNIVLFFLGAALYFAACPKRLRKLYPPEEQHYMYVTSLDRKTTKLL